ncbi:MAG: hypothetical protein FWF23_00530 [Alphaproteobacteria bacterium]|nr:hypothetical protein [Alphaproteobacteria bacterium]MCL2504878.1 hypothetical protein [Alphaproteobacteria bacterium]
MLNSVGSSITLPIPQQSSKPQLFKTETQDLAQNKSFSSHLRVFNAADMSFIDKSQFANAPRGSFLDILV